MKDALDQLMEAEPDLTGELLLEDLLDADPDALDDPDALLEADYDEPADDELTEARRRRGRRWARYRRRAPKRSKRMVGRLMTNVPHRRGKQRVRATR